MTWLLSATLVAATMHALPPKQVSSDEIRAALLSSWQQTQTILATARDCTSRISRNEFPEIIMNLRREFPTFGTLPVREEDSVTFFHRGCEFLAHRSTSSFIYVKAKDGTMWWTEILVYENPVFNIPDTI